MKKIIKKYIYCFSVIIFSLFIVSCNFSVKGEGNIENREIKISNIKEIKAEGSFRIIYIYDNKDPRVILETNSSLLDNFKIKTSGSQLSISESKKVVDTDLYNVMIYNPEIEKIDIKDHVNMDIDSMLRISKLDITLSNNTKLLANNLIVDRLNVKITGAAKINLQGNASFLDLTAKDESNFSAPYFEIADAAIKIFNVAKIELNIINTLSGRITDNSEIILIGNPAKNIKQEKLAQIKQKL